MRMDIGYVFLAVVVLFAAFAQGFSGFGYGILVMAAMSLLGADLERTSVFVTLTVLVLVTALLLRSRSRMRVDWKQAGLIATGLLLTIPIGYRFVLRYGDMPVCRIVFGLVLVLFALNRAAKPHLKHHIPSWLAPVFGMLSGLLSGAFSSGGPPVVLYLYAQEDDPRLAVGTIQAVFLGGSLFRLAVVLAGSRGVSSDLLLQALWMAPLVVLATLLGFRAAQRVSGRLFMVAVYGLIVLAGVVNLAKGLSSAFLS